MKLEWKKHEKALYGTGTQPALVEVPRQQFILLDGSGDPGGTDFSARVTALFTVAYAVKMGCKAAAGGAAEGICDFAVYPLEGLWRQKNGAAAGRLIKEDLEYTLMIRQPDFVSAQMVGAALERAAARKPSPLYREMVFGTMQEGTCIQLLHVGPYDAEPLSFEKMDSFAAQNGLRRTAAQHREIYLNNANTTAPNKRKTILRYAVQ